MKNILYIISLIVLALTGGCSKEETTAFNDYDKNWLVVEDDANDASTHARYLFFKETGIPVFANDTIGTQQRIDVFGKEYTHYEKLSMSYSLGGVQTGAPPLVQSFTYCNKADVGTALTFLRDEIIPVLPEGVHVPSILLVDDMTSNAFGSYAFKGFNTVVIAQVSKIPGMDAATRANYKAAILRAILTNTILESRFNSLLDKFYAVSRKYVPNMDAYGLYIYSLNATNVKGLPDGVPITTQAIGFLGTDPRNSYYTPISTWMDVCMYLEAAVANTQAQFKQKYGDNQRIMDKYAIIRQIFEQINFKIQ
ncbi:MULTISPECIES: hypothetical protein [unclassified Sphingobacterium]|uniref:hypothetical protein n=1 Tax=unclassified Sphingobacterium TaxID=2609468 RepID=UPI0025DE85E3|nr:MULTISPECIES: hypothetical protein [unclassified Sphingobacterium]